MSVRDLPVLRSELLEVLSELSRDRFFVEYNVYFSCHLLQSAVALHGLGTSKVKVYGIKQNSRTSGATILELGDIYSDMISIETPWT